MPWPIRPNTTHGNDGSFSRSRNYNCSRIKMKTIYIYIYIYKSEMKQKRRRRENRRRRRRSSTDVMWAHMKWHCAYFLIVLFIIIDLSSFFIATILTPRRREEKLNIYFYILYSVLLSTNRDWQYIIYITTSAAATAGNRSTREEIDCGSSCRTNTREWTEFLVGCE